MLLLLVPRYAEEGKFIFGIQKVNILSELCNFAQGDQVIDY